MARAIVVEAREVVACPKCSHRFPLSEGISRQAIERALQESIRNQELEVRPQAR